MTSDLATEGSLTVETDRSIPFVDAHHHLWDLRRLRYGWLEEPGRPAVTALLGDYKMIRVSWPMKRMLREFYGSNVVKSVHVEAGYAGTDPVEETVWLESIASSSGFPHGLVVYCDLDRDDAPDQLDRHLDASPRTRGVRSRQQPDDAGSMGSEANVRELARRGLSYDLNASPGMLRSGRDMALAHPSLLVMVGHAGFPLERGPDYFGRWKAEMSELAAADNVACKISGFGMVDHPWTVDGIRPWVLHCIEAFGVDRCMFATNWPVEILYGSYLQQVDAYRTILQAAGFDQGDQLKLLSANAQRLYRI